MRFPAEIRGTDFYSLDHALQAELRRRAPTLLARDDERLKQFGTWVGAVVDEAAGDEQAADRRGGDALAEGRDDPAGDEDVARLANDGVRHGAPFRGSLGDEGREPARPAR